MCEKPTEGPPQVKSKYFFLYLPVTILLQTLLCIYVAKNSNKQFTVLDLKVCTITARCIKIYKNTKFFSPDPWQKEHKQYCSDSLRIPESWSIPETENFDVIILSNRKNNPCLFYWSFLHLKNQYLSSTGLFYLIFFVKKEIYCPCYIEA